VIEDDPDTRKLISEALRGAGFDVVPAVDGAQALRTALARRPSAVVLDIGLPDFDGTQFVARWRERRPDSTDVPIVIVSGRADRREVASLVGAARVFDKPFEVEALVDEVERVLN
jgi:DNA-binding response OmpR family regulator